jgi:hypothetical protein
VGDGHRTIVSRLETGTSLCRDHAPYRSAHSIKGGYESSCRSRIERTCDRGITFSIMARPETRMNDLNHDTNHFMFSGQISSLPGSSQWISLKIEGYDRYTMKKLQNSLFNTKS